MTGHVRGSWLPRALIAFCFLFTVSGRPVGLSSPRETGRSLSRGALAPPTVPLLCRKAAGPPGRAAVAQTNALPGLTKKQTRDYMKENYAKMKRDADELVALAKSLQEDIDKGNEKIMSLQVIDKAKKIEKLAKKIRSSARGY
jgi:hypothetical protein